MVKFMKNLTKKDLLSLNGQELKILMHKYGQKPYRAQQLFYSLHKELIDEINNITCLSHDLRKELMKTYEIYSPKIKEIITSTDGTIKYVFVCFDGEIIESVFIHGLSASKKCTLCVSSQVGCAMNCAFCATAKIGFIRNLLPSEIVGQVYKVLQNLMDIKNNNKHFSNNCFKNIRVINNIVYMGMGEPLNNYKNVIRSINLLMHEKGQLYSSRRITVSTSGVVKNIARLGYETGVQLAVSLNATNDLIRTKIMPINKKWNIDNLLNACKKYPLLARQRITFEYIMISGINDSNENAKKLANLIAPFNAKINLIIFNEHSLVSFKKSNMKQVLSFQQILFNKNINVFIRKTFGDDINAACGMLNGNKSKKI